MNVNLYPSPTPILSLSAKNQRTSLISSDDSKSVNSLCFLSYGEYEHTIHIKPLKHCDNTKKYLKKDLSLQSNRMLELINSKIYSKGFHNNDSFSFKSTDLLMSGHEDGSTYLWNLSSESLFTCKTLPNYGSSIALGLIQQNYNHKLWHHTRDKRNTVVLYDFHQFSSFTEVQRYEINTKTYCKASSDRNSSLLAIPCGKQDSHNFVSLYDVRVNPKSLPISRFRANYCVKKNDGMLMSLAFYNYTNKKNTLACGMESGRIYVHDIRQPGSPVFSKVDEKYEIKNINIPFHTRCFTIGSSPITCLDIDSSHKQDNSIIILAGTLVDSYNFLELTLSQPSIVSLFEGYYPLKKKIPSCKKIMELKHGSITEIQCLHHTISKPGLSVCKLRKGGRVFAVGGLDGIVRLYRCTKPNRPLVLYGDGMGKQSVSTITALEWMDDYNKIDLGIMAVGHLDGHISLWRSYPYA